PRDLLREAQMLWARQGTAVGTGQTASGAMPMTSLDGGGIWKATLGAVGLYTPEKRRTWRAIAALTDGGAASFVATVSETVDAPWPLVGGVPVMPSDVPNSDNSTFSDGSDYESGAIEASAVGAVALRATAMTVRMTAGSALQGGEYFA